MKPRKYIVHIVLDKAAKPAKAQRVKLEKVASFGAAEYSESCIDLIENEKIDIQFVFRDWQTNDALSPFVVPRPMLRKALNEKALEFIIL